ncbi:Acetamidase [Cytospora mali]|uniref:Acetamidase n=1 Tax=Cytospora mali TaxID=578113 RepID=A0A194W497_CYTMA|nr:Acetamidase [Valsa mali]
MSDECAQDWQARAAGKRSRCERLIPPAWKLPSAIITCLTYPLGASKNNLIELDIPRRSGILTEKELRITEAYDVRRLLKALASGELSRLVSLKYSSCKPKSELVIWMLSEREVN